MMAGEQIKRHLSRQTEVKGELKVGADDKGEPRSFSFHITREQFEVAIAPLVARTIQACDEVLSAAQLTRSQIDEVIMVGGSTRIPFVRKEVERPVRPARRAPTSTPTRWWPAGRPCRRPA